MGLNEKLKTFTIRESAGDCRYRLMTGRSTGKKLSVRNDQPACPYTDKSKCSFFVHFCKNNFSQ